MKAFESADLLSQQDDAGRAYLEFLREASLSCGIYHVPTNATDPQQPHDEDEVYYVLAGRGRVRVAEEDRAVQSGSLVYVGAGVSHYFYDVTQDLRLLVFFAPAEGASAGNAAR